ncbi:tyrosine-protein phosphatase non-receptor type 4 isoform X2 [Aethina tumida]|uniref:tyrosine-protein phosphatase non-receptor type 4 isoform X2 n=1 Tax=Aethina tumida TaxID=116153 RepID=UPI0021492AD2|nr:tyrosine-protein phosphatase non-receptor type 4 isoform X2 [Aethina tumida]
MNMLERVARRAFSGSSGTYNVHALELAAARDRKTKGLIVTVHFLDNSHHEFTMQKRAKGAELLDLTYKHLELVEKDYFGLQFFVDISQKKEYMRWLDPSKSVKKQLANCQSPLYFRVKFYVSDPSKLLEEYTRYYFFLQLRRDILEQRLVLPISRAILFSGYIAQAELGDFQPGDHEPGYLSKLQLVPDQTEDLERKISEFHKELRGLTPADCEFQFLDHAKKLEMYGVELHKAKDSSGKDIQLGVTHLGLLVFQNGIKINTFSWSKIMKISFKRKEFFIRLIREPSENYDTILIFNMDTYRSSKTLWKACVEHHTFFRLHSPKAKRKFPLTLGSKFSYSGRTEFQTVTDVKQRGKTERKFVRSPSKQLVRQTVPAPALEEKGKVLVAPARPPRPYDNKVTVLGTKEPKKAWTEESRLSDDDGSFLERTLEGPFSPGIAGRVMSYADEEPSPTTPNEIYDTPPDSAGHSPCQSVDGVGGIVTIVLFPDQGQKYGFNVTGGTTRNVPIKVSRVAADTPADKCTPKLSEGDVVLKINSHDVTHALHEEVVALIHEARNSNDGKLVLQLKQSAPFRLDFAEPLICYVPDDVNVSPSSPSDALQMSVMLLADGLASGQLVTQYEMLYRKHPELTCDESAKPKNVNKNRYRDISPYDSTRVVLKNAASGDYINANFVNMHIPHTDIVNRYIATQGPLPTTTEDFWQMILENDCSLIVMLTTLVERGRPKCHQYWPGVEEVLTMQNVTVKGESEEDDPSGSFVFRDFTLHDIKTNTDRKIKHMQYTAWPDHGVPDSPTQFLIFTDKVMECRGEDVNSPIIVHCSAGIGRTGVLVLMETALCLIANEEPVYPLEIVKTMREQRAMMIQNASQYRFVCECVHAAYMTRSKRHSREVKENGEQEDDVKSD